MKYKYKNVLVIFVQQFKEPEAEAKRQLIIVSLTRSSAVAEAA